MGPTAIAHQYIERSSRKLRSETFWGSGEIRFLYSSVRERAPWLFRVLTGKRFCRWLAYWQFDSSLGARLSRYQDFLAACGVDFRECLHDRSHLNTPRKIFERKIRYWECRPMPNDPEAVVSPADSRALFGSLSPESLLFVKNKFFTLPSLLGGDKRTWLQAFEGGTFAIFRLTPDKYHYTHTPVAGKIVDFYPMEGAFHSCHPEAVVSLVTPYSLNRRLITVIDTDVPGGTNVGLVAMVEVVALMIGHVVQGYSEKGYENPVPVGVGLQIRRGCPKSLFKPGSSTVVLLFQKRRVRLVEDILANLAHPEASSIFSRGFHHPLVETDVPVRSLIATRRRPASPEKEDP